MKKLQEIKTQTFFTNDLNRKDETSFFETKFLSIMKKRLLKINVLSILMFLLTFTVLNSTAQVVQTFTTSGSWTCPVGVTSVKVECWGGGGAGGGANKTRTGGGGGGGGAFNMNPSITVIPGNVYTITVGAGGVGSTGNGGNGGVSIFGSSITANGGVGGSAAASSSTSAAGGAGGVGGTGGTTSYNGGNGATGLFISSSVYYSGGGGGAAGSTGAGAAALATAGGTGGTPDGGTGGNGSSTWPVAGLPGAAIGAGGSGGTKDNNTGGSTNRAGGNGANGQIRITYTLPLCSAATAQPTALVLTPGVSNISGSFTASATASGYLVVMTTTSTAPSNPVNGTTYTAGTNALGGKIIASNSSTTFNATSLAATTQYWFWVFSYRAPTACTGVITYTTVSPLTGNSTTISCGAAVNSATINTYSASFNWSALSWSLGHVPTACESVMLVLDRTAATGNEDITVNLDVAITINNFTMRNVSNTTRRIVFSTSGTSNMVINGFMTMECPGGTVSNRFNRCVFGNAGSTTIYGDVTLGRIPGLATATEGHSAVGSTTSTPGQTFTLYGNMTFNTRGYTTDEWAVFIFNKAGTQYLINNTRPLTTDTIQPVLFEDLRIGTTNATTLIMQGSMFDGYIEMMGRAGITIGNNSVLELPANYSLNVITGGSTSILTMLPNSRLKLGGDRSISDVFGTAHGVTGSNFPNGLTYNLDPTSTIEYNGASNITQTILHTVPYTNLETSISGSIGVLPPNTPSSLATFAEKITTNPITVINSFTINANSRVTLGTAGSTAQGVTSTGPLLVKSSGALYCNNNTVSGAGTFTMESNSLLGIGSAAGITALGTAAGNIQMTGGRSYASTGNYIYNGIVPQVTGLGLPTTVNDLITNNTTTVTIANNQIVNAVNYLQAGVFDIGTNKVTINGFSGIISAASGKMNATVGTVEMKGTSGIEQDLSGNWFVNKTINILTNANTKGIKVAASPADTLLIAYALDYAVGLTGSTTITNDNLTLLSRSTGTANFGNSTGNAISGKVNIERYMPARSAWRLLATPVQIGTSPTISQSWRESNGAFGSTGYGTRITGPTGPFGAAGVLDEYSVRGSMKSYNSATNTFTEISNANTTAIANTKGYFVFVRGDRANAAILGLSGITNMRIKGDIRTGNQVFPVLGNKFESIGNPYPSRIDMRTVSKSNIVNAFTIWNPNSAGTYNVGAYETYTFNGTNYVRGATIRNFIESGEAFFVQSNSATPGSLTIKETDKGNGSANVSRPGVTTPTLEISMFAQNPDGSSYLADGAMMNFDNAYSANIDNYDVRKITNTYDNIAIRNGSTSLIVERRPNIVSTDTIKLYISGMRIAPYRLEIDPSVLNYPDLTPIFIDKFLNTETVMSFSTVTTINFETTADVASRAADRFMIVFRSANATTFSTISANRNIQSSKVTVSWNVQSETAVSNYTIERSLDGTNFTSIATVNAVVNNGSDVSYTFVDVNASSNKNWYRVKANIAASSARYTAIAMVNEVITPAAIAAEPKMNIFPNPVENGQVNLRLYNQPKGNYTVIISNRMGQILQRTKINVTTDAMLQTIYLGAINTGIYQANIIDTNGKATTISFMAK